MLFLDAIGKPEGHALFERTVDGRLVEHAPPTNLSAACPDVQATTDRGILLSQLALHELPHRLGSSLTDVEIAGGVCLLQKSVGRFSPHISIVAVGILRT